jgi:hypothetical protein
MHQLVESLHISVRVSHTDSPPKKPKHEPSTDMVKLTPQSISNPAFELFRKRHRSILLKHEAILSHDRMRRQSGRVTC